MAAVAVGFVVFLVVLGVVFLDSGADDGKVTLNPLGAYPPGTITRIPEHGFYLVRTPAGAILALSDLDAANRNANPRCRVDQVASTDPALATLLGNLGTRMNPQVTGSTTLLRESCHQATYDSTGLRLDLDGPNLDRLKVTLDAKGAVVVDTTKRTCTERDSPTLFAPVTCS
jgi:hypothetical protein